MWLRNFDNLMLSMLVPNTTDVSLGTSSSSDGDIGNTSGYGDGYLSGKTTLGTTVKFDMGLASSSTSAYFYPPIIWSSTAICFGTGTAEVTYDDYKLSGSVVITTRTDRSNTYKYNADTGKWERTIVIVYANTTTSDLTVFEWGIWRGHKTYTSSSSKYGVNDNTVLLYREVLAEPITIPAGTTAELTFTIEFPMPNHP